MTTVDECLAALCEAGRRLGESPSKAQYEALGLTPASGTIIRICGGWNEAKKKAGLETFQQSPGGGEVAPKPDWVELPAHETWDELSPHQRWYRKNRERQEGKKRRRRNELRRWLHEYKREECSCTRCGRWDLPALAAAPLREECSCTRCGEEIHPVWTFTIQTMWRKWTTSPRW